MTQKELEKELKDVLKKINKKEKEEFKKDLELINKKTDKLDTVFQNIGDWFGKVFSFGIDNKIIKIIEDIAENIENPKLDSSIKVELENLISKFLDKGLKEQEKSKSNTESQSNTDNKGKALWEETKKVRKAL